jgi:hypothetical protein
MICFNNFKKKIFGEKKEEKEKGSNKNNTGLLNLNSNNFGANLEKREVL